MSLMPFSSRSSSRIAGTADSSEEKRAARRYTFSLSFSGLLTGGIVMIIAIGWIFAFGVIVGRGYNPEKKLPELARLLPPPEGQQAEEAKEPQKILKPEELTFMTDLKQNKPVASAKDAVVASPGTAQPSAVPVAKTPAEPEKPKFEFVFQAAAYKGREPAERLRQRLDSEGVRSRIAIEKDEKGRPKWFRVQAVIRGTDGDAAKTKEILNRVGLTDATQVSKKPVTRSR